MADHRDDLAVDELLRHRGGFRRIGFIVFGEQFQHQLLAGDFEPHCIDVFNPQLGAALNVEPDVGLRPRQRRRHADLDGITARWFLFATGAKHQSSGKQRNKKANGKLHGLAFTCK